MGAVPEAEDNAAKARQYIDRMDKILGVDSYAGRSVKEFIKAVKGAEVTEKPKKKKGKKPKVANEAPKVVNDCIQYGYLPSILLREKWGTWSEMYDDIVDLGFELNISEQPTSAPCVAMVRFFQQGGRSLRQYAYKSVINFNPGDIAVVKVVDDYKIVEVETCRTVTKYDIAKISRDVGRSDLNWIEGYIAE